MGRYRWLAIRKRFAMRTKRDEPGESVEMKMHIMLIYRRMIPSIQLCGHSQLQYLNQIGEVEYRAYQEMELDDEKLNWADVILLGRLDDWYERQITTKLHRAGKYLIYILDDDLLNIPKTISSSAYYAREDIQQNIRAILEMSDALLSPSPVIFQKYLQQGQKPIRVEEPALRISEWKAHEADGPVKIGFAGSIDRTADVELLLEKVFRRIHEEYGEKVKIQFCGAHPSFAEEINAECAPFCESYEAYLENFQKRQWDIGLAPMPDAEFHACKHYIKLIEYGAAGTAFVYSNVEPYSRFYKRFGMETACKNTEEEWYQAVKELLDNREKREELRKKANICIRENFSVQKTAEELYKQLSEITYSKSRNPVQYHLGMIKAKGMARRCLSVARTYGWKLPMVAIKKLYKSHCLLK